MDVLQCIWREKNCTKKTITNLNTKRHVSTGAYFYLLWYRSYSLALKFT